MFFLYNEASFQVLSIIKVDKLFYACWIVDSSFTHQMEENLWYANIVGAVPKYNRNIIQTKSISQTHIHMAARCPDFVCQLQLKVVPYFLTPKTFKLYGFPIFWPWTWWRLFQKLVVCTELDIYVFN